MNRTELIDQIANQTDLTKKQVESVLNAFTSTVLETLKEGGKVQLMGFGTFEVRQRASRMGRNPSTGEPAEIAAKTVPAFRPSKNLKDELKQ